MAETNEDLYKEREKRVSDAIALEMPDRLPVIAPLGGFAVQYAGITRKEEMYDIEKSTAANLKATIEFQPDMAGPVFTFGPVLEVLGYRQLKWPGYDLPDETPFQFVEGEYMKANEYEALLSDPTDFILRTYWPRIMARLGFMADLPPLHNMVCYAIGLNAGFLPFASPRSVEAFEAMRKAGEEGFKIVSAMMAYAQELAQAGFPLMIGSLTQAPFDTLGDYFRGTRGVMIDMYRNPAMVIKACEKILPWMLEHAVAGAKASNNPRVLIPLHKGQDGFMSLEQFRRFYWPTFRELLVSLVNEGLTPVVCVEGSYTSRLDIIRDVPEGKILYWFEDVDMHKAKEALAERVCIMGGVPLSILVTGTQETVKERCKWLIDLFRGTPGYILGAGAAMDDSKENNVRAMISFSREYADVT